jgi:Fructose-2,6-bisphosphatase
MTRLIFVRHGESEGNKNEQFIGHGDVSLTEIGYKQAKMTAIYLDQYPIDAIYSSDLKRAYQTAQAVADRRNGILIKREPNLREINAGLWEGVRFDEIVTQYFDSYQLWMTNIGKAACDGGESFADLQQRVSLQVEKILEENREKTVLVACHATPIRAMSCIWKKASLQEARSIDWVSNASITIVDYDENNVFELITYNYNQHLGELKTDLPINV